jgi:hypothetical protein
MCLVAREVHGAPTTSAESRKDPAQTQTYPGFNLGSGEAVELIVVQNFFEELKAKVGS